MRSASKKASIPGAIAATPPAGLPRLASEVSSAPAWPGRLARFLERFVTRPGYGIGLGSAETMELAIREVGAPRILFAAAASAVTRPFGVHGVFYRLAGPQAKAIDGPTSYTIPPYNQAATLGPRDPDAAARAIAAAVDAASIPARIDCVRHAVTKPASMDTARMVHVKTVARIL